MTGHAERRSHVLQTAEQYVNKDRNTSYSEPTRDFEKIAGAWDWWLNWRVGDLDEVLVSPTDVAAMMILMKLSRLVDNQTHEDSWIDIAGYAACGFDVATHGRYDERFDDTLAEAIRQEVAQMVRQEDDALYNRPQTGQRVVVQYDIGGPESPGEVSMVGYAPITDEITFFDVTYDESPHTHTRFDARAWMNTVRPA